MSLFETSPARACAAYTNIRNATTGFCLEAQEHCDDLWRDYACFADANFETEFPVYFHERWFEMYLAVSLMRAGLDVQCPKPGPDILLHHNGRRIWIEATCANPGDLDKLDSVPETRRAVADERIVATQRPTDAMTLRFCNSLDTKQKAFATYRDNNIVHPNDATVVAINVHAVPNAWVDMDDLMRRTLYGLGDLTLTIDRESRKIVDRGYREQPEVAKQATGARVNALPFVDGSLPHVSAVLGSSEDAANRPSRLGDGFVLYPNLSAAVPWQPRAIRRGQEWIVGATADDGWDLKRESFIP